ncbi:hypothetical protein [Actinoplanes auranticolor]|uniref:Uncharacterized protein n=1 Tax=Actinoplanes auranticolor TaxID=47988 RepID=A0A919SR85_9ACTN|nr:hypothetical protein [Actinoplanes auranticolor]GIM75408.1 hypothetical protein Aau02nite_65750 [Actinoplanes auranticolor]
MTLAPFPGPDPDTLTGLVWHHAWICLRLGHPAAYAKGAHLLPAEVTDPLQATLVRDLTKRELQRALIAAITVAGEELRRTDTPAAARLVPMLSGLTSAG